MCKYRVSFGNEIFENKVGQDSSLISNTSESDFFKFSIKLLLDKSYTYRRFSIVQVSLTTIHLCYLKLTSLLLAIFAKLKIFLYLLIFGLRPGYSIQSCYLFSVSDCSLQLFLLLLFLSQSLQFLVILKTLGQFLRQPLDINVSFFQYFILVFF